MNSLPLAQPRTSPIELANKAAFQFGRVLVTPALREVAYGHVVANLEPRVMQVLVGLAEAEGRTVSRNELITRCWDGRVVGDNAINQVIARLRRLSEDVGAGGFEIQTVKKVGYRLIRRTDDLLDNHPRAPRSRSSLPRRGLLAGGAVALAVAGGALVAQRKAGSQSAAVRALYARAVEAQRLGERDDLRQSVAYLQQATQVDEGFAPGWGALALSYRTLLESSEGREQSAYAAASQAAARKALGLDPSNADAQVALALQQPNFRNWQAVERACQVQLRRHPGHWYVESVLASVLADVGRWTDEIQVLRRLLKHEQYRPTTHTHLAVALWASGRSEEAGRRIEDALRIYPSYAPLWITKFNVLALTGKPDAALALLEDGSQPAKITVMPLEAAVTCARALESGDQGDRAIALSGLVDALGRGSIWPGIAAQYFCALGSVDGAYAAARGYLFGRASGVQLLDSHAHRSTAFLFNQPAALMRADPRFTELTEALQLETYWRQTGMGPDYRLQAGPPAIRLTH